MGWCPVATSMMLNLRIASATPGSTSIPSSSGPRWRIASHIRCASARAVSRAKGDLIHGDSTKPAMPHMVLILHVIRRTEVLQIDVHFGNAVGHLEPRGGLWQSAHQRAVHQREPHEL